MKAKKFEPKYEFTKNCNDSWCASAYFINKNDGKDHIVTIADAPGVSIREAKNYVKGKLTDYAKLFLAGNPEFVQVNHDDYIAFTDAHRPRD